MSKSSVSTLPATTMSSSASPLLLPLVSWLNQPTFLASSQISSVTASEAFHTSSDSSCSVIVAAFTCGNLCIYHLKTNWSTKNVDLIPRFYLVGHNSSTVSLCLAKVDFESIVAKDNVVFSASRDGEIAIWDLNDGRCIQVNPVAFAHGIPTSLKVTSSGQFVIIAGHSSRMSILNPATLEVLKDIPTNENWISSFCLYPSEKKQIDRIFFVTLDGVLAISLFDESSITLNTDATVKINLDFGIPVSSPAFHVEVNRFDKHLVMVVHQVGCAIYEYGKSSISFLLCIPCPKTEKLSGGKFLSARTILLWTKNGGSYVYFIGNDKELLKDPIGRISPRNIVLFSDGVSAIHVEKLAISSRDYSVLKSFTLLGQTLGTVGSCTLSTTLPVVADPSLVMLTANSPTKSTPIIPPHLLLCIKNQRKLNRTEISVNVYWASLFGTQLVASAHRLSMCGTSEESKSNGPLEIPKFSNHEIITPHGKPEPSAVSAVTLVMEKYLAVGHENGDISVILISTAFFSTPAEFKESAVLQINNAHNGRVTALYSPDERFVPVATASRPRAGSRSIGVGKEKERDVNGERDFETELEETEMEEKILLLSGGFDCSVKIWNLVNGEQLASFVTHSSAVTSFMSLPAENCFGYRMRHGVLSFAKDHSISIIDVETLDCRYKFTSSSSAIVSVHWRTADELFIVQCADATVNVWQTRTGHLDRSIPASVLADEIIASCDIHASVHESSQEYLAVNAKKTISAFSLRSSLDENPSQLVFLVNIKRLVSDIYSGYHVLTPNSTPNQSTNNILSPLRRHSSFVTESNDEDETVTTAQDTMTPPNDASQLTAIGSGVALLHRRRTLVESSQSSFNLSSTFPPRYPKKSKLKDAGDLVVASIKLRAKGLRRRKRDENRKSLQQNLQLGSEDFDFENKQHPASGEKPDSVVVQSIFSALVWWDSTQAENVAKNCGLKQVGGGITYATRGANGYLSISVPYKYKNSENMVSPWSYSPTYTAARLLQILTLARSVFSMQKREDDEDAVAAVVEYYGSDILTREQINENAICFPSFSFLAKYWQDPMTDVQLATRILVSSALNKMSPMELNEVVGYWRPQLPIGKSQDLSKLQMRATIILGIIGSSYPDALDLNVRRETSQSLDIVIRNDLKNTYRMAAVELIGHGFSTWEPYLNVPLQLKLLQSFTGLVTPAQQPASNPNSGIPPQLMLLSRQTIIQIADANPSLFVNTVSSELVHSKSSIAEKSGNLKLVNMFISKKPVLLFNYLPKIVESMVKTLDPNQPAQREAIQQLVTLNLVELVKTYPTVTFHSASQRLCVGTNDAVIVVYDLRTATRFQILEGHTKALSAVSFSPDGRLIASFSLEENCVMFWQPAVGFLGTIVGAFGTQMDAQSLNSHSQMKSFRRFNVGAPETHVPITQVFSNIGFHWSSDRSVKLNSIKGVELSFTV